MARRGGGNITENNKIMGDNLPTVDVGNNLTVESLGAGTSHACVVITGRVKVSEEDYRETSNGLFAFFFSPISVMCIATPIITRCLLYGMFSQNYVYIYT